MAAADRRAAPQFRAVELGVSAGADADDRDADDQQALRPGGVAGGGGGRFGARSKPLVCCRGAVLCALIAVLVLWPLALFAAPTAALPAWGAAVVCAVYWTCGCVLFVWCQLWYKARAMSADEY